MKKALDIIVLGALVVVALMESAKAAQADEGSEQSDDGSNGFNLFEYESELHVEAQKIEQNFWQETQSMNHSQNVAAFLTAIARAEGTENQAEPYRVCYAYKHVIRDLRDHPAVTGEWRGERLTDTQCAGAGLGPGCVSTAAGRYQFIKPTWLRLRQKLGLTDFSPASQDKACIELLRENGALSMAGQGTRSLPWLQSAYVQAGGALA
jgi:muramidase (phage lysozyme)